MRPSGAAQGLFRQGFAEGGGRAAAEVGERVLIAAGMPAYAVQDMGSTPRTNGTLLLTTHALWWRPAGLRTLFKSAPRWRRYGLMLPRSAATEDIQWGVEACLAGPFGLGVMDTALRLRAVAGGGGQDPSQQRSIIFNFPLHQKHRDSFLAAIAEVQAAHAFAAAHGLGYRDDGGGGGGPEGRGTGEGGGPTAALPATVTWALLGATVRLRVRAAVQCSLPLPPPPPPPLPRALAARPRARSCCFDWDPQPPRRRLCARSGRS
jgi:hypothetical protein